MKPLWAVIRKELITYFSSPLAYVILTAFLLINGWVFYLIMNFLNSPQAPPGAPLRAFFGGTLFYWILILFLVPAITMRLISEERKTGTIEFLLTTGIQDWQVILGKFGASFIFYLFLWAFTLIYIVILAQYTALEIFPIAGGYLGIFLQGALLLSAGLCASTFSKNQIVSAIWAFVLVLGLFMVGMLNYLVPNPELKDLFSYLALWDQMEGFAKGILDSRSLVYSLSFTVFFLFLSIRILEVKKWR